MTQVELLQFIKLNPFVLAPMAGITDRPFRSFMRELGCGAVVSELASATGLKYSPQKTLRIMAIEPNQSPVGIQLFGENLDHLSEAAKVVEQLGADFVDLNFGCPVPKVVNKGAGSACLKDLEQLRAVIRATVSAVKIPVTIKVRTGWNAESRNTDEVLKIAGDEGVTWVAIHGRTRAAGYSGLADWDYIQSVKAGTTMPVLGNGDITSPELAVARLNTTGVDAVMIGRGCLKNPFIFQQANALWRGEKMALHVDRWQALQRLLDYLEAFYDEHLTLLQMRKFAAWYSSGYSGAAQFRKDLFQLKSRTDVLNRIEDFFAEVALVVPTDTSQEAFLMGGHG